jgi:ArsR family transcriptional regulator
MYSKLFGLEEEVFKILANQKRLEIIQLLRKQELNVTEMIAMLGLRQANLSQHLSLLRQNGLVSVTKKGREIYYKLADDKIGESIDLIYNFLRKQYNLDTEAQRATSPFPIVIDPICGMRISASEAYASITDDAGKTYYFCASGCENAFLHKMT